MIPKTKEYAAARLRTYRATEALRLDPENQELIDKLAAAHAGLVEATAAALLKHPAPVPHVNRCTDPHPRHRIEAEMYLKSAEAYKAGMIQARAAADTARQALKHMEDRSESYTAKELAAARRRITEAETRAKYEEKQFIRATRYAAASMDRAEGKPKKAKPHPDSPAGEAHAKRVMRWQRTEQRLMHVQTSWANRLETAMETFHPDPESPGARWQQRCRDYLHQATARLAAYRRDHGLATPAAPAPEQPDPLEKDEHGNYIL